MERIEYVSRMEDFAAYCVLEYLHINRRGKETFGEYIRQWLLFDLAVLVLLYTFGLEWTGLLAMALILGIALIYWVITWEDRIRIMLEKNARATFDPDSFGEEQKILWFDPEKFVAGSSSVRTEISWVGVLSLAITPNWIVLYIRAGSLYLHRQSVITGDFDRFVAEAVNVFQEVKQQQGQEAKIIQLDPKIKVYREPIALWRNFLFGFLWGAGFLFVGGLIFECTGFRGYV